MRSRAGRDVLLIDADRQGSANLWAGIRREEARNASVPCVQKVGKGLAADIRDLATRYEDIVIDAGGQDSVELRAAMAIAEFALFPIQPSIFDAATLETLADLVAQAQALNRKLVAGVVINLASTHPLVKEAQEAKELVAEYDDLRSLDVVIRERIIFRKSARGGLSVFESTERDRFAEAEMNALYREVFGDG